MNPAPFVSWKDLSFLNDEKAVSILKKSALENFLPLVANQEVVQNAVQEWAEKVWKEIRQIS